MRKKNECTGCAHWRGLTSQKDGKVYACHYMLDTGKLRGCEPGAECTRKAAKISRRRRYTQFGTEEVTAHDNEGMAQARD